MGVVWALDNNVQSLLAVFLEEYKKSLLPGLQPRQVIELPAGFDWNVIKELQASERVTMKVEGSRVELIGLVNAVQQVAEELKERLVPLPVPREAANVEPMLLGSKLTNKMQQKVQLKPPPGLERPEL